MANYLITGAAGFIGSALAQKFINQGDAVVTIDKVFSERINFTLFTN